MNVFPSFDEARKQITERDPAVHDGWESLFQASCRPDLRSPSCEPNQPVVRDGQIRLRYSSCCRSVGHDASGKACRMSITAVTSMPCGCAQPTGPLNWPRASSPMQVPGGQVSDLS